MVKITNGIDVIEVTEGAFETIYSKLGFRLKDAKKVKEENKGPDVTENDSPSDEEVFVAELLEKPISNWNKNEVKKFAEVKGIDISGTKNANEAKEIIKSVLEQE